MKPIISYKDLLFIASKKNCKTYFQNVKRFCQCFTGNIEKDVPKANEIILKYKNNNTAHGKSAFFKWAFNEFYGMKFNCNYLIHRSSEISKFTTRLDKNQIMIVRQKFKEWIDEADYIKCNTASWKKKMRIRLMFIFESLLCSGMRVGEFANIDFRKYPAHRIITSKISNLKLAEIIINTEKTCKKREVYIPNDAYFFFTQNFGKTPKNTIVQGFISFRKWAKLQFQLTSHVLRRTKASIMHECGVDVNTIAMVLGNTPNVVINHYIISSNRNFDACDIANNAVNGYIVKTNNLYFNKTYLEKKDIW